MIFVVALAALLIGFAKAGVAGTLGPFVTVLMALALPADDALGVLLPMLIFADSFSVAMYWRRWDGSLLPPLLASAVVGIGLGSLVVSVISEVWLQRIIAIAMLLFAVAHVKSRGIRLGPGSRRKWAAAAGSTAGFTSTLAHSGGPPIVVYLMTANLEPVRFVGTSVAFFAAVNLIKVPGYLMAGLFDGDLVRQTLVAWPLIPVGVVLGRMLVDRIDRAWFEQMMLLLLVVGALVLLVV